MPTTPYTRLQAPGTSGAPGTAARSRFACLDGARSAFSSEKGMSHACEALKALYLGPDDGPYRQRDASQRQDDLAILEQLNADANRQDPPCLVDYIEGGNGEHRIINDHLRGLRRSDHAARMARALCDTVSKLTPYPGIAYRATTAPAGVYGQTIVLGDVIHDGGLMSASALPQHAIHWMETWTAQFRDPASEHVLLIFDETVPKHMAAGGMLADHVLVTPDTPLKVKEIHRIEGDASRQPVVLVRLKSPAHPFEHDMKNCFTGDIDFPALERSWSRRFAFWR
ncbi:hypothetical protein [Pararobbsia silviterrae]|nr:hypothetical protein [Pararobbsia silviterrae]